LAYGAAGIAMGTRFLLTRESTVPDAVKQVYLGSGLDGTVVTRRVDGMPHRVLRTALVDHLEKSNSAVGLAHAVRNARRFKRLTQLRWRDMVREGLATKHDKDQTWTQLIMAANTPMLLRAGLVDGNARAGVLASGQVVGMLDDLPSCADLVTAIVTQAEKIITELAS
jgi:NAD(P)H-dependent flavin oxidoreductase YrpB (nitropropane dioxygenase family)